MMAPTPNPECPTPDALRVDWELDIEDEQLEGGEVKLASLIFSSAAGQAKIDNFTPDALRAMADMIYDHANDMDGREFFNRTGLKRQLARAIPYIGVPQYAVPDGLVDECERAAGIDLPIEEQMARAEYEADDDNEDAA